MKSLTALAAITLAACATTPTTSGPTLPPALQRVLDDYTAAWEMHDGKALAALFAEGRTVTPNSCGPVQSRAEVERCYSSGGPLHLRARDHAIAGDLAYIIGEYALDPTDTPRGNFTLTLALQDGVWRIVSDMDRSYAPPRLTPAPSAQP